MAVLRAEVASEQVHTLAEGPVWDAAAGRLRWVDIAAGHVFEGRLDDDRVVTTRRHELPGTVGAVVPAADGGLLVAGSDRLVTIGVDGEVRSGPRVLPAGADSRFNDGACDPAGRFLVGSLARDDRRGDEALYRVDADGTVVVVAHGFTLSNGIAWAPDGATLYHVDSVPGVVWARPYDLDRGEVGTPRALLADLDATPDGLAVDAEGHLWVAMHGAGEVRQHRPDGRLVDRVAVPAPETTNAAFVGPDLDRLLVTTAREHLDTTALEAAPRSGCLFLAEVGVRGLPTAPWAGHTDAAPGRLRT